MEEIVRALTETVLSNPVMTAVQFADHAELGDTVDLNELGRLAKTVAGPEGYNTVPHPKYGKVGYLPVSFWMDALGQYYDTQDSGITPEEFLHLYLTTDTLAERAFSHLASVVLESETGRYPVSKLRCLTMALTVAVGANL